jgi:hypothetical protein
MDSIDCTDWRRLLDEIGCQMIVPEHHSQQEGLNSTAQSKAQEEGVGSPGASNSGQ